MLGSKLIFLLSQTTIELSRHQPKFSYTYNTLLLQARFLDHFLHF